MIENTTLYHQLSNIINIMEIEVTSPIKVITGTYNSFNDSSLQTKLKQSLEPGQLAIGKINEVPRLIGNIKNPNGGLDPVGTINICPLDSKNDKGKIDFSLLVDHELAKSDDFDIISVKGVTNNINDLVSTGEYANFNVGTKTLYLASTQGKAGTLYEKIKAGAAPSIRELTTFWKISTMKKFSEYTLYSVSTIIPGYLEPISSIFPSGTYALNDFLGEGYFETFDTIFKNAIFTYKDIKNIKNNYLGQLLVDFEDDFTVTSKLNVKMNAILTASATGKVITITIPTEYRTLFSNTYMTCKIGVKSSISLTDVTQSEILFNAVASYYDGTIKIYHNSTVSSNLPQYTRITIDVYK